jgi:hypothetical protein
MISKSYGRNPLDGLNPDSLPIFNDGDAEYIFKVKRRTIVMNGDKTLADLGFAIEVEFELGGDHMSSFYMGKKFLESARAIGCPSPNPFDNTVSEAEKYKICQLNLYEKQKFLFLYDFIREQRFTIMFAGCQ